MVWKGKIIYTYSRLFEAIFLHIFPLPIISFPLDFQTHHHPHLFIFSSSFFMKEKSRWKFSVCDGVGSGLFLCRRLVFILFLFLSLPFLVEYNGERKRNKFNFFGMRNICCMCEENSYFCVFYSSFRKNFSIFLWMYTFIHMF